MMRYIQHYNMNDLILDAIWTDYREEQEDKEETQED